MNQSNEERVQAEQAFENLCREPEKVTSGSHPSPSEKDFLCACSLMLAPILRGMIFRFSNILKEYLLK